MIRRAGDNLEQEELENEEAEQPTQEGKTIKYNWLKENNEQTYENEVEHSTHQNESDEEGKRKNNYYLDESDNQNTENALSPPGRIGPEPNRPVPPNPTDNNYQLDNEEQQELKLLNETRKYVKTYQISKVLIFILI